MDTKQKIGAAVGLGLLGYYGFKKLYANNPTFQAWVDEHIPSIAPDGGGSANITQEQYEELLAMIYKYRQDLLDHIKVEEANAKENIWKKYITVEPYVTFSDVTGKLWIGRAGLILKNKSEEYTFPIVAVRWQLKIKGYVVDGWVPGYGRNMGLPDVSKETSFDLQYKGSKSDEKTCLATWQDKVWFDESGTRDAVREYLREHMDDILPILNVRVWLYVKDPAGALQVVDMGDYAGTVRLKAGAISYYYNEGYDAKNWLVGEVLEDE